MGWARLDKPKIITPYSAGEDLDPLKDRKRIEAGKIWGQE